MCIYMYIQECKCYIRVIECIECSELRNSWSKKVKLKQRQCKKGYNNACIFYLGNNYNSPLKRRTSIFTYIFISNILPIDILDLLIQLFDRKR